MAKYHINSKTGKANVCRAVKKCPLGDDAIHFPTEQAAKDHIEATLKQASYGFVTVSKSSEGSLKVLQDLDLGYSYCLSDSLPDGFSEKESIQAPDYYDSHLVTDNRGNHFVVGVSTDWDDGKEIASVIRVRPEKVKQVQTTSTSVSSTKDYPEVNDLIAEVKLLDEENPYKSRSAYRRGYPFDEGEISVAGNPDRTFERDDGSKIHCFSISAEGDREFTDLPAPIGTDVGFSENGQRQNGRLMDVGYMIYDTRSDTGVLLQYQSGSEGGIDSGDFTTKNGYLEGANAERYFSDGNIYVLQGAGSKEVDHYKAI